MPKLICSLNDPVMYNRLPHPPVRTGRRLYPQNPLGLRGNNIGDRYRFIMNPILCGLQYIPRNMHTVFVLLCFVVVIHWQIFPYPSGLLHWHCGNLTIAPVPAKQPWWIWINTSCEFIMNDCITTTKQSTTKPCAYFLGYTVYGGAWSHSFQYYNNVTFTTGLLDSPATLLLLLRLVITITVLQHRCTNTVNSLYVYPI